MDDEWLDSSVPVIVELDMVEHDEARELDRFRAMYDISPSTFDSSVFVGGGSVDKLVPMFFICFEMIPLKI